MPKEQPKEQTLNQVEKDLNESIFGKTTPKGVLDILSAEIFGDVTGIHGPTEGHSEILDTSMNQVDGKPIQKTAPVKEDSIT
jgi:hypothetical protein